MSRGEKHDGADIYKRGKIWWGRWRQGKNLPPIRKSLDTESAELAAELWREREREIRLGVTKRQKITVGVACDLYWTGHVVSERLRSAANIRNYAKRAIKYFGATKLLTQIDRKALAGYRNHLLAAGGLCATVINEHIGFIPRICTFVDREGYEAPFFRDLGKTNDRVLLKDETLPPRTIDSEAEQAAVMEGFRLKAPDLLPMFRMGQLSGTRKMELFGITKPMVDFKAGVIRSRQKGDRPHDIPITKEIYDILVAEWGNHPVYVFTYVCRTDWRRRSPVTGEMVTRVKGERYPWDTCTHLRRWDEVRAHAGSDVQWHAATRAFAIGNCYDENGELATMEAIGVESPQTVRRYAKRHSDDRKRASLDRIATPRWRESAFTMPTPTLAVIGGGATQIRHTAPKRTKKAS